MEGLKKLPLYRRFGFRIFFFNALLIICVITPILGLKNRDYKILVDRGQFQEQLFAYMVNRLESMEWNEISQGEFGIPMVLPAQRLTVFTQDGEVLFNQAPRETPDYSCDLIPRLPTPYLDHYRHPNPNPQKAMAYYRTLLDEYGGFIPYRTHQIINLQYEEGMDRILIHGMTIGTTDDQTIHVFLQSSVVDILKHWRALKEQYILLFMGIAALGFLLAMVLSWSVTLPLRSLYRLSLKASQGVIFQDSQPQWGELGEIRHSVEGLMERLQLRTQDLYDFSSDMVHQLKTPMAALRSGLELYAESEDRATREKLLHGLFLKMQQMEMLMNQVESLGRLEVQDKDPQPTEITTFLESLAFEFPSILIEHSMNKVETVLLRISDDKLHILLSSLIGNAVDFSPELQSVILQVDLKEEYLFLGVYDQGPGIAPEVMDQITQRFFSYRKESQTKHSGLGLAMVQSILQNCGGSLEYGNNPKGGAYFHCWIPLSS